MQEKQLVPVARKKFSLKRVAGVVTAVSMGSVSVAHADTGVTLPTIDVSTMVGFMGVLVTAIATVSTANLLIPMTAKGIKAIRAAF